MAHEGSNLGPYFEPESPPPGFVNVAQGSAVSPPLPVLASAAAFPRRPSRHAIVATLAVLVFPLTGVLALASAFAVDDALLDGDVRRARSRSRWVLAWGALSWMCAVGVAIVAFVMAVQVVGPAVAQVSSQWSGALGSVGSLPAPGGSGLGSAGSGVPGLPGGVELPGVGTGRAEEARRLLAETVERLESSAGVSEGKVSPALMWEGMRSSGQAPDGQLLLAHGVVGMEVVEGVWQVSVLSGSAVCVVAVDVSGARSLVGAGSC